MKTLKCFVSTLLILALLVSTAMAVELKKGDKGDDVKFLQWALLDLGYLTNSAEADGIFGSKTQDAVVEFQKDCNLETTGIIDLDDVYIVTKLTRFGYDYDGYTRYSDSGYTLSQIISAYQSDHELEVTGSVNAEFMAVLSSEYEIYEELYSVGGYGGNWDKKVTTLISEYQEDNGLSVTGVADDEFLAALSADKQFREDIESLGYDFGQPKLRKLVSEYQQFNGLSATGIIDDETKAYLDEELADPEKAKAEIETKDAKQEAEAAKKEAEEAKKKAEEERQKKEQYIQINISNLKDRLKNPSSLQIHSIKVYQDNETSELYFDIDYSAMNGLGGYNRSNAYYRNIISINYTKFRTASKTSLGTIDY